MREFTEIRLKAHIQPDDPVAPVCDMIEVADERQQHRVGGMVASLMNLCNLVGDLTGDNKRSHHAAFVNAAIIASSICVLAVSVLFAAKMIISVFLADTKLYGSGRQYALRRTNA